MHRTGGGANGHSHASSVQVKLMCAPVPSFATSCQRVCVPRWKPIQLLFSTEAVGLVAVIKNFLVTA